MESNRPDRVTAFDTLFTTNHIQMLKLLLSYLEPSVQGKMAVYIKFMELQYTLNFFQNHPFASMPVSSGLSRPCGGISELLDEMLPFCTGQEKDNMQNLKNMMQNLDNMQEMMQILEMMQEISPDIFDGSSGMPGFDTILGGSDMSQMMEMMQGMFHNSENT
ncbi:MAG: hypothetical protein K2O32_05185 [Acetatifactor sp.]|nr:hypothetical protein [Acetatifactor sp.]